MSTVYAERRPDGSIVPIKLATGERHTIVVRTLELDHRYHDDGPIDGAAFLVRFANGYEVSGKLDSQGRARLVAVPPGSAEVRYGPDSRPFQPVEQPPNPDYSPQMSEADVDGLFAKYAQT